MSHSVPIGVVTILADSVDVHEFYTPDAKIVGHLHKGDTFKVYRKDGNKYGLGGGMMWIPADEKLVKFTKA